MSKNIILSKEKNIFIQLQRIKDTKHNTKRNLWRTLFKPF